MADESIDALTALGFTGLEAEVYTALLRESPSTGYRVAQSIGKPAANTYKAIESLENKGAVIVEEGESRTCRAVPPKEVLARLDRGFRESHARATKALSRFRAAPADDRVYQMRSREQVLERCRRMLERCKQVALIDIFPEPLGTLRPDIEAAAARGIEVTIKAYQPAEVASARVVVMPRGTAILERWPGEWVNLVVDGEEYLLAFLERGGDGVHQAVWSGSAYLSWVYHSAVSSEIILAALESHVEGGASAEEVRDLLASYQPLKALEAPGYQTLMRRFGNVSQEGSESSEKRSRRR